MNDSNAYPESQVSGGQPVPETGSAEAPGVIGHRQLIEGLNALDGPALEAAVTGHFDSVIRTTLENGGDKNDVDAAVHSQSLILSTGVLDRWIREDGSVGDEPVERGVQPTFMQKIDFYGIQHGALTNRQEEIETAEKDVTEKAAVIKRDWFSYKDVLDDPDAQQKALDYTMASASADMYARAMAKELRKGNEADIDSARNIIRGMFDSEVADLPEDVRANLSPFAKSDSWILWDIAKQKYLATHGPGTTAESDNRAAYRGLGLEEDPLTKENGTFTHDAYFMQRAIADRHLGWELQQMAVRGEDMTWLTDHDPEAADLLNQPTKPDDDTKQLHSWQYVLLGREAAVIAAYMHSQHYRPLGDQHDQHLAA